MEYTAIIRQTEDGWYAAKCAQIPEAITQGKTIQEATENLADAITMILEIKKERSLNEAKLLNGIIFRDVAVV